jgi:ribosomal protein L16 Arg81 hydroxylase
LAFKGEEISPLVFSKSITSVGAYQADKNKLLNYFDKGYTIKFDKLHQTYPPIANKVSLLEQEIGLGIRTSLYITPANSQGYGIHTDRHDVLALQINGTKLWKVKMSDELLPSVYDAPVNVEWDQTGGDEVITVNSGDFFYCPRGLSHDVHTTDLASTHFTLGLKPVYKYEVLNQLSKAAYEKDSFRTSIPNNFTSLKDKALFLAEFKAELHALIENVSVDDLLEGAIDEMKQKQLNVFAGAFASKFYEFDNEDIFLVKEPSQWVLISESLCVKLSKGDKSYNFPLQLKSSLESFLRGDQIRMKNLEFVGNKNQSLKLVKRLVSIKFLTVN